MKTNETRSLTRLNGRYAKEVWGEVVGQRQLRQLRDLTERYGFSIAGAEIQLLNGNWYVTHAACCDWPSANTARGSESSKCASFVILQPVAGYSKRLFTKTPFPRASPATEMLILQIRHPSFAVLRCAWRRLAPSTALSARPLELAFVLWKSWVGSRVPPVPRKNKLSV